ncbi:MAG: NAD+ synthase [Candidatus Methanomethylophilaceae archaeon]|jgi:NAD+ synthase
MAENKLHEIDAKDVEKLTDFIIGAVERTGCKGLVVGLSGGIDSAVVTKLCVDAIGADRVLNIFMPTSVTALDDYKGTRDLSKLWGTTYKMVDIQPAVDAFTAALFSKDIAPLERGNISARCRMIVLFNNAKKRNYMVVGTSNRSELMMGYFTKFGDGASDMVPMADLYKTQVWEVAKIIGVPQEYIDKVPTAGLWEGQTDESEMGVTYRDLDHVLNGFALSMTDGEIAKDVGIPEAKVAELRKQVAAMEHKRTPAYVPDVKFNV